MYHTGLPIWQESQNQFSQWFFCNPQRINIFYWISSISKGCNQFWFLQTGMSHFCAIFSANFGQNISKNCVFLPYLIYFWEKTTNPKKKIWLNLLPGVNILPKEQIFSPMLPSCDHKVSPFLPQFCDYMRGSVATKPLTAWGPGARLRAPGGVQGQSPWWGSRGQRPRKLHGFSQFNILRNSLQRALS